MKRMLLVCILLTHFGIQAQQFDWVATGGSTSQMYSFTGAIALARDSHGNVYTLDHANTQQQCQGTVVDNYGSSIFIYKFNSSGTLVYLKAIGTNFTPLNLTLDDSDNLYVLGALTGTNQIQMLDQTITDTQNRNYVFKFDPEGNLIWVIKAENFNNHAESSLLLYANGFLYIQSGISTIAKLELNGNTVTTLSGTNFTTTTSANGIHFTNGAKLSDGNLVFVANSMGSITIGGTALQNSTNPGLFRSLLTMRTTSNLQPVWANYTQENQFPTNRINPLAVNNADEIFLGVKVLGSVTAGTDVLTNTVTGGSSVGSILKMDGQGNKKWIRSITNGAVYHALVNDPANNGVIGVGQFYLHQPILFGSISASNADGGSLLTKIDYDGNFLSASGFVNGIELGSQALSVTSGSDGNFYVGGRLLSANIPSFSCIPRDPNRGMYVAKFTEGPSNSPTPTISNDQDLLSASPEFDGNIQWFLNGEAIEGANGPTHLATEVGNYTVTYNYVPACQTQSSVYNLTVLSTNSNEVPEFRCYPNPTSGVLYFSKPLTKIALYSLSGQQLLLKTSEQSISLSELSHGIYILKGEDEYGQIVVQKIIKE